VKRYLPLFAFAALVGCSGSGDAEIVDANNTPKGPVPGLDGEAIQSGGVKRLTVDELQASVPVVAGLDETGKPIQWTIKKGANNYDGFSDEGYGVALGRPDWVINTIENPEPSPLYAKFARDMSLDVCNKLVKADLARTAGQQPTLWRMAPVDGSATPAQRTENIKYLVLRFLGIKLTADDSMVTSLEALRAEAQAHPKGVGANAEAEGWRAVCIALFQDPAFHID